MKVTVELKMLGGERRSYTMFEEAEAIYVEAIDGLKIKQDSDLPGYVIEEAEYEDDNRE